MNNEIFEMLKKLNSVNNDLISLQKEEINRLKDEVFYLKAKNSEITNYYKN